ncbi:hypothetical protein HaLaN_08437, partial [Haematococcus lacustris]
MPVEMSQQVGYDVGQRPAERLTRARSRPLATGQVAADTAPGGQAEGLKQALINRVQSGRLWKQLKAGMCEWKTQASTYAVAPVPAANIPHAVTLFPAASGQHEPTTCRMPS